LHDLLEALGWSLSSISAISPEGAGVKRSLIVAVGHVKVGVGKTTLAVNLAISQALCGKDVLLVDGDEQGTARAFTQLRADVLGAPGYTAVSLRGAEIRTQVRLLRPKYECIVVDVGGRDTASLRAALTVADMLIVPVLPATFDVWSLEPLGDLIQEAREINGELKVVAVLNAADAQGRDNEEAAAIIREKPGFEYFPHPIIRRKAFRNAAAAGLSVSECRPSDEKAIREFTVLANHVFGYTGDIASISYCHRKAPYSKDKDQRQAS
jgi:chromosome partitioning protein